MVARAAALLSLLLAGPALAGPPLSPAADNDAIFEVINAADPSITDPPAPVGDLIAAAELAETRLAAATTATDVGDLLTLAATARKVAYRRTAAAIHLCALLDASRLVLAREGLPASVQAEASGFADEARADLAAHSDAPCMQPPAPAPPAADIAAAPRPALNVAAPSPLPRAPSPDARRARGLVRGGAASLGLAGLAGIGLVVVRAIRVGPYQQHTALVAEAEAAGGATPEQQADMLELNAFRERTRHATIGLAVSGAVLAVLGGALVGAGINRRTPLRAQVAPYGGPFGAGLGLHGRF